MTICFDLHVQMASTYPNNIVVLPIVFGALAGRGDAARRALRGVAFRAPEAAHAAPGVRERRTALAVAQRAPLVGRVPLRDWQRARRPLSDGSSMVPHRSGSVCAIVDFDHGPCIGIAGHSSIAPAPKLRFQLP
jgi:hypothetical protein